MKRLIILIVVSLAGLPTLHAQHMKASKIDTTSICSTNGPLDVVACYGADNTGATDSTTALNSALSAATNQTRYLPAGVYKISGTLNVDTRYKVTGAGGTETAPYGTIIQATGGFGGTMLAIKSTYAQTSVILGGMEGLFVDCNGTAAVGAIYGGSLTTTVFGYRTTDSVFHNCVTAGVEISDQAWLLSWFNVGFQGNAGDGLQVLDKTNMGENLNCYGCTFSNNTGNGLTMGPASLAQHDLHCHSCSFDTNTGWAIQNQTATTGDSVVDLEGSYIFQHDHWIKNYGRTTISGSFFGDGSNSGTLTYLVDNEAQLQIFGGRWTNSGSGAYFNPAQTGNTNCYSLPGFPTANCSSYVDGSSGNAIFGGLTGFNVTATNAYYVTSSNGQQVLCSATLPTVSSGFNSGSIGTKANGTCSFFITVGSGTAGSTGTIGLPTATGTGWNCFATNQNRADVIQQTANTTTSATLTNFGTTFAATNWTNGDNIIVKCSAR